MEQFGKNTLAKRVDGIMKPVSGERTVITSKETLEKRLIEVDTDPTKTATVEDMRAAQTMATQAFEQARTELEVAEEIKAKLQEDRDRLREEIAQVIEDNSYDKTLVGRATNALSGLAGPDLRKFFGGIAQKQVPSSESTASPASDQDLTLGR